MRDMSFDKNQGDFIALERYENEFSAPYVKFGYPGFPNKVGMKYINLVKGEFMGNQTLVKSNMFSDDKWLIRMTFGTHKISVESAEGKILWSDVFKIDESDQCDFFNNGKNLIKNGNFDENKKPTQLIYPVIGFKQFHLKQYRPFQLKISTLLRLIVDSLGWIPKR